MSASTQTKITVFLQNDNSETNESSKVDSKAWIETKINDLVSQQKAGNNLPFKIIDIKTKGFVVKVSGLFGFIAFNHMPWRYGDKNSWTIIYPKLKDKYFYCLIHEILDKPKSLIINGAIPQFNKPRLKKGSEYTGIIIKKLAHSAYIELGYHLDWKFGSIVGLLKRSLCRSYDTFTNYLTSNEVQVIYLGTDDNGQMILSTDRLISDWYLGIPQKLVGKMVWVRVIRDMKDSGIKFLVIGKYIGKLTISDKDYQTKYRKKIKRAKNELPNGKIIKCDVTGFDNKNRTLDLIWHADLDTDIEMDNSLINTLDPDTIKRLKQIKDTL